MDLRQLEILRAVAQTGSFTSAGQQLHLSQSAVSRQILLLEEELKEQLFLRLGRKIRITPAGTTLLGLSERMFEDLERTRASILDTQRSVSGTVRLVGGMTVCLYVFPPLLQACCRIIGGDFKLSSLHARTLRPHTAAQELHVDVDRASADWPLVGFILMIDEFRPDNGATRFVPGTHHWSHKPEAVMTDRRADYDGQLLATGPAGSLIVFNGSTWHGHAANTSSGCGRSCSSSAR